MGFEETYFTGVGNMTQFAQLFSNISLFFAILFPLARCLASQAPRPFPLPFLFFLDLSVCLEHMRDPVRTARARMQSLGQADAKQRDMHDQLGRGVHIEMEADGCSFPSAGPFLTLRPEAPPPSTRSARATSRRSPLPRCVVLCVQRGWRVHAMNAFVSARSCP